MFGEVKVGVALGGGAARGLAHLGVLEELEREGVQINLIAGTSMGAVVGAMYALNPKAEQVSSQFVEFLQSKEFTMAKMDFLSQTNEEKKGLSGILSNISRNLRRSVFYGISLTNVSYLSSEVLSSGLLKLIPKDATFADCKIPFSCCATDLNSQRYHYFNDGSIVEALVASCSIPGIFPPVRLGNMVLIDGSWSEQNPVRRVISMGAEFSIAIDILQDEPIVPEMSNSLDVITSGNVVTRRMLAQAQLEEADMVICPDTCDVHWANFGKAPTCVLSGRNSAKESMAELKQKLKKAKLRKFLRL